MDWEVGASGYAAVWATENTREAIWDAMQRKETYATTGPRMTVRFFGGWDFTPRCANRLPAPSATRRRAHGRRPARCARGQGTDLPRRSAEGSDRAPISTATRSSRAGSTPRANPREGLRRRVGRRPQARRRRQAAAVGNTVDVANATWTNTIGAPELIAVWKDPDFDPGSGPSTTAGSSRSRRRAGPPMTPSDSASTSARNDACRSRSAPIRRRSGTRLILTRI